MSRNALWKDYNFPRNQYKIQNIRKLLIECYNFFYNVRLDYNHYGERKIGKK